MQNFSIWGPWRQDIRRSHPLRPRAQQKRGEPLPKLIVKMTMRSSSVKSLLGLYMSDFGAAWVLQHQGSGEVCVPLLSLHPSPPSTLHRPLLLPVTFRCTFLPFRGVSSITFNVKYISLPVWEVLLSLLHLFIFSFYHTLHPGLWLSFAMKLPGFTRNSGHQQKNYSNVIPRFGCSNTSKAEDPCCFFFSLFCSNCTAKPIHL